MPPRQLSPYEKNQLARYGQKHISLEAYGEMPVEYITGKVEFCNHVFAVTPDTLIPRVETEELVALALATAKQLPTNKIIQIADIGTGCGAIAISLYLALAELHRPMQILASDISEAALAVAQQNSAELIGDNANIMFIQSDLLSAYPATKFDLMVANLPYIPSERIPFLEDSVTQYEPHLALDGGPDGLKYIKKLLWQARSLLTDQGKILLEIDYTHTADYLIQQLPLTGYSLQVIEDQFSRNRFAIIQRKTTAI